MSETKAELVGRIQKLLEERDILLREKSNAVNMICRADESAKDWRRIAQENDTNGARWHKAMGDAQAHLCGARSERNALRQQLAEAHEALDARERRVQVLAQDVACAKHSVEVATAANEDAQQKVLRLKAAIADRLLGI